MVVKYSLLLFAFTCATANILCYSLPSHANPNEYSQFSSAKLLSKSAQIAAAIQTDAAEPIPPLHWTTKWFEGMPIDHFGYSDVRTFRLRYLINTDFWDRTKPGPIFFLTACEAPVDQLAFATYLWQKAEQWGAMFVAPEHRYFGQTLPFGNESWSNLANLGFLTADQALADYARLITWLKSNITGAATAPVLTYGGSYCGVLSAWMRIKYPHIVLGSLASAAPLPGWGDPGMDPPCTNWGHVATHTFRSLGGQQCVDTIKQAWPALRRMGHTATGRDWLNEHFKLCPDSQLHTEADVDGMVGWLHGELVITAEFSYPFHVPWPAAGACQAISPAHNGSDMQLLDGMFGAVSVFANSTGAATCLSFHTIAGLPSLTGSSWLFMTCSDLPLPLCYSDKDMFENRPYNWDAMSAYCSRHFFGVTPSRDRVRIKFGVDKLKWASNIIFTNGMFDPISGLSITKPLPSSDGSIHVINIPMAAHGYDLFPNLPMDTPYVRRARSTVERIFRGWLDSYYADL